MTDKLKEVGSQTKGFGKQIIQKIDKAPVLSFFILLALLVLVIFAANIFRTEQEPEPEVEKQPLEVTTYAIGNAPKVRTQAEIEKSGVVKIVAQTGGVVQQINVTEGQEVWSGTNIAWLSTNYQGGTVETVNRQKAGLNYQHANDTIDKELEIINLRREEADKNYENAIELKKIQDESESETRDAIDFNQEILEDIETQITQLEAIMTPSAEQESTLLQLKQSKAQLMSSNNQLKQSLRNTEYQTRGVDHNDKTEEEDKRDDQSDDSAVAKRLDEIQRDKTKAQLDLEEKSKKLAMETAALDLRLRQIQEALMYPASPVNGVVERVYVNQGQVLNPGELIAMVTASNNSATAVALVSSDIARSISMVEPTVIGYNRGNILTIHPSYISKEPTEGTLHSVQYAIPDEVSGNFSNGSMVNIEIPIGYADTSGAVPFIPVDAVYQTQENAFVYLVKPSKEKAAKIAHTQEVSLGPVFGSFVEVKSGLNPADQVIINRNVVDGDEIITQEHSLMETQKMPETGNK